MSNLLFLSAEIVSDCMILMKKDAPREPLQTFPLGHFAVEFLNRIGEKSLTDQMQCAFPPDGEDYDLLKSWDLDETEYVGFGKRLLSVLDLMKRFPPYSMYDQTETRTEIEQLFTAENYALISEWHRKLPRSEKTRIKETILLDFTSLIRDLPYCKGKALFEQTIDIAVDFMSLLLDFEELDLPLQRFTDAVSARKGADTDLLALLAALNYSGSFSEVETKYKVQSQEDFTYKVVRVLTFSDYVSFVVRKGVSDGKRTIPKVLQGLCPAGTDGRAKAPLLTVGAPKTVRTEEGICRGRRRESPVYECLRQYSKIPISGFRHRAASGGSKGYGNGVL